MWYSHMLDSDQVLEDKKLFYSAPEVVSIKIHYLAVADILILTEKTEREY